MVKQALPGVRSAMNLEGAYGGRCQGVLVELLNGTRVSNVVAGVNGWIDSGSRLPSVLKRHWEVVPYLCWPCRRPARDVSWVSYWDGGLDSHLAVDRNPGNARFVEYNLHGYRLGQERRSLLLLSASTMITIAGRLVCDACFHSPSSLSDPGNWPHNSPTRAAEWSGCSAWGAWSERPFS